MNTWMQTQSFSFVDICLSVICSLPHWGQVKHICISNVTTTGSDNALSPGSCRAIVWINAGILLLWPQGTNSNEILKETHTFSFTNIHFKLSSGKWWPFCLGLSLLSFYLVIASYSTKQMFSLVATHLFLLPLHCRSKLFKLAIFACTSRFIRNLFIHI